MIRLSVLGTTIALVAGITAELREARRFQAFQRDMQAVRVSLNIPPPNIKQTDIDLAMTAFTIQSPRNVHAPELDASMEDRGLAISGLLTRSRRIKVGPEAFQSWAILGSTLAHEIEIHGKQSFAAILFLDGLTQLTKPFTSSTAFASGDDDGSFPAISRIIDEGFGTWAAERAAYTHEIRSSQRFGLTTDEVAAIQAVRDYYYPTLPRPEDR